jgi:HD superfamily phosphohydrolase
MSGKKRVRTLLYGDQQLSPAELELLHTPSLQRLYDLHQLGLADRVFIDASHSRLHHVVGVLHHVEKLAHAVTINVRKAPNAKLAFDNNTDKQFLTSDNLAAMVNDFRPVVRMIGLLHDLTHAPYGHTLEDEIRLVDCKHDDPSRQADAFYRLVCELIGWWAKDSGFILSPELPEGMDLAEYLDFIDQPDSEPPSDWSPVADLAIRMIKKFEQDPFPLCWRLSRHQIVELLAQLRMATTALLHMELLHTQRPKHEHLPLASYPFQKLLDGILADFPDLNNLYVFVPARDAYLLDMVGNTVCADLLDYARRDTHHASIKLDYDSDRIAENFTIVSWDATHYEGGEGEDQRDDSLGLEDPFRGWCLRTAISLFSHKLRIDVPSELMNLLNVRFYLYERVLFHSTKCAAGAMLGTALQLLGWRNATQDNSVDILPKRFRHTGDAVFLHDVAAGARLAMTTLHDLSTKQKIDDFRGNPQFDVAISLLSHWGTSDTQQIEQEVGAGVDLLRRIRSRRYFRPVFRTLPGAGFMNVGPKTLSGCFSDPSIRYAAERKIEQAAGLRTGSVVIHCPKLRPAQKVANVLLSMPSDGDVPIVRKLRHISEIDKGIFAHHEKAISAVELMYQSMWRLVVYVSPEYLSLYSPISLTAGRVISQFVGLPSDKPWENDKHLTREIQDTATLSSITNTPANDNSARMIRNILTELALEQGNTELLQVLSHQTPDKEQLTQSLLALRKSKKGKVMHEAPQDHLISIIKGASHHRRLQPEVISAIHSFYEKRMQTLPAEAQNDFLSRVSLEVLQQPATLHMQRPLSKKKLLEFLESILRLWKASNDA